MSSSNSVAQLAEQRRIAYDAYWSVVNTASDVKRRALARQLHDADYKWRCAFQKKEMTANSQMDANDVMRSFVWD